MVAILGVALVVIAILVIAMLVVAALIIAVLVIPAVVIALFVMSCQAHRKHWVSVGHHGSSYAVNAWDACTIETLLNAVWQHPKLCCNPGSASEQGLGDG